MSRDRPFAEYGVDSLTAVEMSHELEQQFSVPLPPIVAWNYPTPAALARFLAEETLGVKREEPAERASAAAEPKHAASGVANDGADGGEGDAELAALLAEVESLSDADAERLLAQSSNLGKCRESLGRHRKPVIASSLRGEQLSHAGGESDFERLSGLLGVARRRVVFGGSSGRRSGRPCRARFARCVVLP